MDLELVPKTDVGTPLRLIGFAVGVVFEVLAIVVLGDVGVVGEVIDLVGVGDFVGVVPDLIGFGILVGVGTFVGVGVGGEVGVGMGEEAAELFEDPFVGLLKATQLSPPSVFRPYE